MHTNACMMAAGHVTILGWFEFTFCSAESWEELMQFGTKIAPNSVSGHLLVPELIIKDWEGLNLANSKEVFIGIMNLTNFDQMLNSSYWQFVVHGQWAIEQMSLVSAGFNLQIWEFQSTTEVTGKLLVYYWSLVRDFFLKKHAIGWR